MLESDSAKVDVKGGYDLGPETYHLTGDIRMKSPADIPAISLSRAGDMKNAPDYTVNIRALQDYLSKRVAKDDTKPVVTPAPPGETPLPDQDSQQPNAQQAAPDVDRRILLKHEGEGDQPPPGEQAATPNVPSPVPAPAPTPDDQQPVHLTPPGDQPAQPPQPPVLPTPAEDGGNGGKIDEPIETEPLVEPPAPPPPPPVQPAPKPDESAAPSPAPAPAPAPDKGNSPIKGILDRLNDGGDTPPPAKTPDKPAPSDEAPPEDELMKQ